MIHKLHRLLEAPRPWRRLALPEARSQHYKTRTEDGVRLHLRRVRPPNIGHHRSTVMMLHGLGSNHRGFHFPGRSLARWLARRGHDVWLPELRGHGRSRVDRFDWCLDEYLEYDIPAILAAIRKFSAADRIHWVGHSMGGILLMCYGAMHPNAPIARGVAVGSALDYRVGSTDFAELLPLRPLLEPLVAIPYGSLIHLLSPLMGEKAMEAIVRFNVWPSNVEPKIIKQLHACCFHSIPTSLLANLATAFEPDGLCVCSGVRICEEASSCCFPLRLIAGSRDAQVSVEAVEHTAELVGSNTDVVVCGADEGCADHYGHWDLLVGRRAPVEVWPKIAHWVESSK